MTVLPVGSPSGARPRPESATLPAPATGLDRALWQLARVSELGQGLLEAPHLEGAQRITQRAGQRRRLAPSLTVTALLGATGSGKSSLLNALLGQQVARTAVTRPTTTEPLAALPVTSGIPVQEAGALLDWLEVHERSEVHAAPAAALGEGTVLLDMPDMDSDSRGHRAVVERMVQLVDVLVWVLDPEKYADALVHQGFLAQLREHARVTLVVLNQVDRLSPADREPVLADLRRLLASEGLGEVPLLAVSARTGEGLERLREQIAQVSQARKARDERLAADVRHWAVRTSQELGLDTVAVNPQDLSSEVATDPRWDSLRRAARVAASVDLVSQAVGGSYRRSAQARVGWIPLRWLARLRQDPLRALHLLTDLRAARSAEAEGGDGVVGRSSLPAASAAAAGALRTSAHNCAAAAVAPLPASWAAEAVARSDQRALTLPDALDRAVVRTDLDSGRRPGWWAAANTLQWLCLLTALTGGLWLGGLHLVRSYLLIEVAPPVLGRLPYPTLLLGTGLLLGAVLALGGTWLARLASRRLSRRIRSRLGEAVDGAVDQTVVMPLLEELRAWDELVRTIRELRS